MSAYTSFASFESFHCESHASLSSSPRQASIPTKIFPKRPSHSTSTSTSSSTSSPTSISASTSTSSFTHTSEKSSTHTSGVSSKHTPKTPSSSPSPSSSSSGAFSLLSTASRSSISSPLTILEDVLSFGIEVQDERCIPVERLSCLVQRYDEALLAAAAEAEAEAYEAKLLARGVFLEELYARMAADRAVQKAERIAALIVRLTPSPEYSDLVLANQYTHSVFYGANWSKRNLRHPIVRKALLFNEEMTSRDYVEDEVVDCWMECWRFMGYDLKDERLQSDIAAVNVVRKSTIDKQNRPLYKKVLSLFC